VKNIKKPKEIGSSEQKKSQKVRNEKHLDKYFIFIHSIVFLVEGNRNTVLKMTLIILNVKDNLKTFYKVMSFRDVAF
jgi:hypothetical protein